MVCHVQTTSAFSLSQPQKCTIYFYAKVRQSDGSHYTCKAPIEVVSDAYAAGWSTSTKDQLWHKFAYGPKSDMISARVICTLDSNPLRYLNQTWAFAQTALNVLCAIEEMSVVLLVLPFQEQTFGIRCIVGPPPRRVQHIVQPQ